MKISVIIPFHNEIELISRAVDSVMLNAVSGIEFEIIICNDGSIPETQIQSKLNAAASNISKIVKNVYAKGPGGARNTGLDASIGDCIAFLDADDVWLQGKVIAQISAIRFGATFVTTAYRFDTAPLVIQPPNSIDSSLDIFLRRGIGTSTVMISRELLSGCRFKDIRFAQDIDFWYKLARSPLFRYSAVTACCVEYNTGGTTKNKWIQLRYLHKVLVINDVPWLQQFRIMSSYVISGVYNHYIKRIFP
jgi:glycosyltransferase involved in cell wall biosynthesis